MGASLLPRTPAAASVRAAKPDAEEARPAAEGNVLRVATRKCSLRPAHPRMLSSCLTTRRTNSGAGVPKPPSGSLIQTSSRSPSRTSTVHWVTHSSRVIEMDGFIGSACSRSRAPQYLMNAMLAGAETVVLLIRDPPDETPVLRGGQGERDRGVEIANGRPVRDQDDKPGEIRHQGPRASRRRRSWQLLLQFPPGAPGHEPPRGPHRDPRGRPHARESDAKYGPGLRL